ncbi:LptF/LptG family permease [Cardiobacterium valvarum]|uniref:Permease, YjgP/YjgQ family n=1 Tax=Cardiobacterium valvarum F0432 TaxID=797473 RepID=G9ZC35_9GAMM|nr:LptF/LptG family permease [Cardiobacterium valvarum]EHM55880.1 permease, YjgP/YjgQ family [Cardiobacterium valvarum F0432]
MLTRFDRYLLRTILTTTLITLAFLLSVDLIIQISAEADDLGHAHYTLRILLIQQLLVLPEKLILFTPAAVLVGTIMGLGQLAAQNEIAVVRAAGISRLRLARAGLLLAFIIGVLNIVNGEAFAPQLAAKSRLIHHLALGESAETTAAQGIWLKQRDTIIHIGALNPDGSLQHLRYYQADADHITITITEADRATYAAPDWLHDNPRRYRTGAENTETLPAPARWENGATPADLKSLAAIGSAETLRELHTLTRFMAANGHNLTPGKPQILATPAHPADHSGNGAPGTALCLRQQPQRSTGHPPRHRHPPRRRLLRYKRRHRQPCPAAPLAATARRHPAHPPLHRARAYRADPAITPHPDRL